MPSHSKSSPSLEKFAAVDLWPGESREVTRIRRDLGYESCFGRAAALTYAEGV